jgi:predicted RNA-binding protein YlxR (DUF448 family)
MNARLAARPDRLEDRHHLGHRVRQQEADAAFGGGEPGDETTSPAAAHAVLTNGKRCPKRRCPARITAACPADTRSWRMTETDDEGTIPIVAESEPEPRGASDTAGGPRPSPRRRPRSGDPEPRGVPGRPRRRAGRRRRRDAEPAPSTSTRPSRTTATAASRRGRAATRSPSARPVRTCAGCGRKAPQRELQRFHAERRARPGAGAGRGRVHLPAAAVLRARALAAAFNRTLRRPSASTRARAALHLSDAMPGAE